MDYAGLGKRIRAKRRALHLTQEKMAELANISFSFVGHIERATRIHSLDTICRIADALDCSIDELIGRRQGIPEVSDRAREIIQIINRITAE